MVNKIIGKYGLSEILDKEQISLAIADADQKILWFNNNFKKNLGNERIKGKKIPSLFLGIEHSKIKHLTKSAPFKLHIHELNRDIEIKVLKSGKKIDGFLLKLTDSAKTFNEDSNPELLNRNLLFQTELQNIFSLLVKEKSLPLLAEEILLRCVNITRSSFGIIVFQGEKNEYNYIFHDPQNHLKNENEIKKEISANLSFISKWLCFNKRSLIATKSPDNIGFILTNTMQCSTLIISPGFFDEKLVATIITGKEQEPFSAIEINNLEQFASILSFAISSIKTRELNTALENRLLQSQKLETIGKLTSGMAHDFSNLLSSIFGSLNLLKKRVPPKDDIIRLIDNIENCSIRAKDLTKGLLSFGKPTPKRKELIKPNLLLSELTKVIIQTFPKNISFENNIDGNLHDILGNSTEIYQVLLNLCVNAKEAIEGKGIIKLIARNIAIDSTNIFTYPMLNNGNYVCFTVKDTGTGIKEEDFPKIFDPYFSTKEKETGSGLGLYVAYGIIKAHQGVIEVSSIVDQGTTFDVFIPSFEPAVFDKAVLSNKIILLADDEIMLRDLLAELLESNDFTVIRVSTGAEALKVLTEEIKVDLVIIDYNMPEMNGLDCISKIRELKFNIPIVLSTGSMSFAEEIDLSKYGISNVLTKPYEFDSMLSLINKLI